MNNPKSPAKPNQPQLYTINPIEPDPKIPFTPEFCRMSDLRFLFGITRSMGYVLMNEGKIRTVSLRRPGQKFSVRLVHLASVRAYLNGLLDKESETKAEFRLKHSRNWSYPRRTG
jgi:hypothetical protein